MYLFLVERFFFLLLQYGKFLNMILGYITRIIIASPPLAKFSVTLSNPINNAASIIVKYSSMGHCRFTLTPIIIII